MSAKIEPLLTVSDLDLTPDDGNRYELFEGELFVSCAPGLSHQRVLTNFIMVIGAYLDKNPIGEILLTPGVDFDEYNGVIPDAVFISNQQISNVGTGERINEAPEIVIEIVSPGKENAQRDRVMKRQVYGRHGVKEYWIVDPETQSLEIYRFEKRTLKLAATLKDEDEVISPALPGFSCKAGKFFGK
ncbi:MAG: Uma2 family endonuclease [Pyrinomonadaceae bacterium]|nr:Uma2 family endonuclease [Pyrinomonadaceae bacterium]